MIDWFQYFLKKENPKFSFFLKYSMILNYIKHPDYSFESTNQKKVMSRWNILNLIYKISISQAN